MKTHLTDDQIVKLFKYIPLIEMQYQEEYWGNVPESFWDSVNDWYEFLKQYLEGYSIDHHTLAIILHEIHVQYHRYKRTYLSYTDSIPLTHLGAKGLLNALTSFEENFLNVESIMIKTKSHTPFASNYKPKKLNDFRIKDDKPVTIRITGKEVILELFKLLRKNKNNFEILSESEEKLSGETFEFVKKNKPKIYFRKMSSVILYEYLRDHFPK